MARSERRRAAGEADRGMIIPKVRITDAELREAVLADPAVLKKVL